MAVPEAPCSDVALATAFYLKLKALRAYACGVESDAQAISPPSKVMSFPRKRESSSLADVDRRLCAGDEGWTFTSMAGPQAQRHAGWHRRGSA